MLATALVGGSGCSTPLYNLPDEFAAAIYECDLARLIHNTCSGEPLPACASGVECGSVVDYDYDFEDYDYETNVDIDNVDSVDIDSEEFYDAEGLYEEERYESLPKPILEHIAPRRRVEVGPPPVTHKPLLPPKFLPVPTRPVFSQAIGPASASLRGNVEVDFGPQLTFPGLE